MNLRDLGYVVALDEEKNFGRAAKRCFVSQPTLSMQVKKLEQELAVALFERDKQSVRLTAAGKTLVEYAKQVLQLVNDMKQASKSFTDPYAGSLKLAMFPTLAPYLLPLIVKKIKKQCPKLNLQLFEKITDDCVNDLLSGSLDAIIIATELDESKLNHIDLFSENFYVVCPKDHPLNKSSTVSAKRLQQYELLLLEEGHCLREQSLEFCDSIGMQPDADFSATSLSTVLAMVGLGQGITLVPYLATTTIKHHPVAIKAFQSNTPSRKLRIYWRKSSGRDLLMEKLSNLIKDAVAGREGIKILVEQS